MSEQIRFDDGEVAELEQAACYIGLPEETIRSLEQRVRRIKGIVAQSALEIGQELAEARKDIQRYQAGGFRTWVRAKVGITEQYAYQLIAAYERFGECKIILHSPVATTALLLLAAPSVPQEVREEAIQLMEAGEKITVQQAKALIEAKRTQSLAEEAERAALAEAQRAQRQLAEEQVRSQVECARLTQQIAELQEKITLLSGSEARAVEKERIPPDIMVTLEHLQANVQELTVQRDQLSAKAQQLGADLETLREERDREREQELFAIRLRQRWQKATETFRHHLLKLLGQFPSPLDTQVFESEDWERLSQVQTLARRFLAECDQLRSELPLVVVDAEEAHSP